MRRDIAKLLETGQEATARIRVEHIIREEKMMAAQEIIELFCELIAVRLPIIEAQRECPLDLKEAISSVCFAAPRCADLAELLQVQMLFAMKYGKEFVSAATDLMPECGVNRQLIELLSIRAPAADVKLKLLKEIAEEHELDWDPTASETELFKSHEDLLNGPMQFVSGSKLPLPKEKHDESLYSAADQAQNDRSESDEDLVMLAFPEVPKVSLQPTADTGSASGLVSPPIPTASHPEVVHEPAKSPGASETLLDDPHLEQEELAQEKTVPFEREISNVSAASGEEKQFVPFISPPSVSSPSVSVTQNSPSPPPARTKSEANVDLQDVLAAAQAAADTAERAAAAARSAASLAQLRISELKKKSEEIESSCENPFFGETPVQPAKVEKPSGQPAKVEKPVDRQDSLHGLDASSDSSSPRNLECRPESQELKTPYEASKVGHQSSFSDHVIEKESVSHRPQRLPSMDDESYLAYPNLFSRQNSSVHSTTDNSQPSLITSCYSSPSLTIV
ncbi:Vacuolar protein sorting-associated protein Ist1 [Dillenia turbinata]|uniref:Vacuolar protein sorting-associated protein Ist1 n=1 Tax=Dillenia turbinata TaxID=194707 RepID=A0AAN8ZN79_9MAGN